VKFLASMTTRTRRRLRFCLVSCCLSSALAAVIGTAIAAVVNPRDAFLPLRTVVTAAALGFSLPAAEVFVLTPALRRYRFTLVIGLKAIVLSAIVLLLYVAIAWSMSALSPWSPRPRELLVVASTNLLVCSAYASVVGLNRLLGRRGIGNFLTGRYFHPVEEARVFMFLDLASSTTIAEQIGNARFHGLLDEFFRDMTDPVFDTDGEIYKYVGDEVIITWKLADGIRNANCVRCYFSFCEAIAAAREKYERRFGLVPRFTAGMHCGKVIAGEMGEDRKEVAFLGDVVNTTSRVQAECKAKGERLLLTETLCQQLTLPSHLKLKDVGRTKLRGKEQEIGLFAIERETKAAPPLVASGT
jgi:adenylate cyclase